MFNNPRIFLAAALLAVQLFLPLPSAAVGGALSEAGLLTTGPTPIPVGSIPYSVAVNSGTNLIYVANTGSSAVSVINGATNLVTATVPVGQFPRPSR